MSLRTLETDGTLGLASSAECRVRWCLVDHAGVSNGLLSQATQGPAKSHDGAELKALDAEMKDAQTEIRKDNGRPPRVAKEKAIENMGPTAKQKAGENVADASKKRPTGTNPNITLIMSY